MLPIEDPFQPVQIKVSEHSTFVKNTFGTLDIDSAKHIMVRELEWRETLQISAILRRIDFVEWESHNLTYK